MTPMDLARKLALEGKSSDQIVMAIHAISPLLNEEAILTCQRAVNNLINEVNAEKTAATLAVLATPAKATPPQPEPKAAPATTPQDFLNQEISRLTERLNALCERYFDPSEVWTTITEWRDNLVNNLITFEVGTMEIGTKVRLKNSNQGTPRVYVDHGKVAYNVEAFITSEKPFDGLDHTAPPVATELPENEFGYGIDPQVDIDRAKHTQAQAGLVYIVWYAVDGTKVTEGWHNAETIEVVKP